MTGLNTLIFVSIVCATALAQSNVEIPPPPNQNASTVPPNPPPPTTPTTTTTIVPPTTASTTPPTTPKPITKPTEKPTTPSTTTTPAPTTKPTPPPTTPKPSPPTTPAPAPEPSVATWTANYTNSNYSCVVLQMALQLEFDSKVGNKSNVVKVNVPPSAVAMGSCSNTTNTLQLSWDDGADTILFSFAKNGSNYDVDSIVANISLKDGQNTTHHMLTYNKTTFNAPLKNSYKCAPEKTLNLTATPNSNVTAFLHVSHVQIEAFRNSTDIKFDSAIDCEGSGTPDIVPIVVGVVLATLVALVLVGYLFGRRRCQARGYLSM